MRKQVVLLLTTLLIVGTAISGIACDCKDKNGNGTSDTTAPVITGITISYITETTVTISWITDELATSKIEYGTTTSYGSSYPSVLDTISDKTSHSLTLSGLSSDTIYHFQVKSENAIGDEAISEDQILMTKKADTTKPVIFPDANLEAYIREAMGKSQGDIYQGDLEELTTFGTPIITKGIKDLTGLEHCTNLTELFLQGNQISDLSPISSLTSLTKLWLSDNQISDIEPLVKNPGLGQGDNIYLRNNPLSATSINTYIPALETRGVSISYPTP